MHPPGNTGQVFVTQVYATDLDSGENSDIYYEIKNDIESDNAFTIFPEHTGVILNVRPLNVESTAEYRLEVSHFRFS